MISFIAIINLKEGRNSQTSMLHKSCHWFIEIVIYYTEFEVKFKGRDFPIVYIYMEFI